MPEFCACPFSKIALIGAGLIGGSCALAVRAAHPEVNIHVYDQSPLHRNEAWQQGIASQVFDSLEAAVSEAELIILAIPVGALQSVLKQLHPVMGSHTVITDVGSTKQGVIEAAQAALGEAFSRFVPGHPISGAEKAGLWLHAQTYF